MRVAVAIVLSLAPLGLFGCAPADAMPVQMDRVETREFSGAFRSSDGLVRAAVEAAVQGDYESLWSMRISREEYETILWPELPEKDVAPLEFYWGMTTPRAAKGARTMVREYEGIPLEVVSVSFAERPVYYPGFAIHKNPAITVRRVTDGAEATLNHITGIVEWNGLFKILSMKD